MLRGGLKVTSGLCLKDPLVGSTFPSLMNPAGNHIKSVLKHDVLANRIKQGGQKADACGKR